MLAEIADCVRKGESFTFETTLSGLSYLARIGQWREQGYHVSLFFLCLPDAETARGLPGWQSGCGKVDTTSRKR